MNELSAKPQQVKRLQEHLNHLIDAELKIVKINELLTNILGRFDPALIVQEVKPSNKDKGSIEGAITVINAKTTDIYDGLMYLNLLCLKLDSIV